MAHIDYYFSVLSPFTYLAGDRLERIAEARGATVRYRPLDIIALFGRTGGISPKDRHPARKAYRLQEMRRASAKAGMAMNMAPAHWPTDPVPASTAVISVAAKGGDAGALAHAALRACWAEDRDIADPAVVADLLVGIGEDAAALAPAMDAASAEYDANLEAAVAAGVFGAPFHVVGEELFWGHDRLDDLAAHLAAGD